MKRLKQCLNICEQAILRQDTYRLFAFSYVYFLRFRHNFLSSQRICEGTLKECFAPVKAKIDSKEYSDENMEDMKNDLRVFAQQYLERARGSAAAAVLIDFLPSNEVMALLEIASVQGERRMQEMEEAFKEKLAGLKRQVHLT